LKTNRLIKGVFILFLTATILLIVILSGEVFFRITKQYPLAPIEYNSNEIWHWSRHLNYQGQSEEGQPTHVHTDWFGFRNYGKTIKKPKDVIRIVVIGDSYTEGLGYSDNQIITSLLEQSLADIKPHNCKIEVMGASSPAWSTEQELRCLLNEAKWFEPDYVLLMVCPNDIREAYCKKFAVLDSSGEVTFNQLNFSSENVFWWKLAGNSYLYQFLQAKYFKTNYGTFGFLHDHYKFNFGKGDSTNWDRPVYLKSAFPEVVDARKLFFRLVDEMHHECQKNKVRFAVSVTPLVMEFDSTMVKDTALQSGFVSDMISQYCDTAHIDYVNLYNRFKAEKDPTALFLKSDQHFNARGHIVAAEGLTDYYKAILK
jgi:lysophospholipase L1-like esterase